MERITQLGRLFIAAIAFIGLSSAVIAQDSCPPEGSPKPGSTHPLTAAKIALNENKNRTEFPTQIQEASVADMLQMAGEPHDWDKSIEAGGVTLEGFLLGFKHEGVESPNCYDETRRDFHMWVGAEKPSTNAEAKSMRAASVVVEPTPFTQDQHPRWSEDGFMHLIGRHVRVTGWFMFDPEHPDQIGHTRGTLWEVHPVMKIEVMNNGQWEEF